MLHLEATNGAILLDGSPFLLKGASYFGMETDISVPHGLWGGDHSTTLATVGQFLSANNFNLVRLPLAVAPVVNNLLIDRYKMGNEMEFLKQFESRDVHYLDVLDYVVKTLQQHKLLILLDLHVMQPGGPISPLWYDETQGCSEETVVQAWMILSERYKTQWNVIGADLNNEPHGEATWGSGDVKTDWRLAAKRLADKVLDICPHWLIFVEGVQTTSCDEENVPCFWGENLQAAEKFPVQLENENRLVYCPHTYGPAVSWQPYFGAADFPGNMQRVWDAHFGYLKKTKVPLVIGEWGGQHANAKDWTWQMTFTEYAQQLGMSGVVFWCVNPNGGDTDGLLRDDWRTPNAEALQLLSRFVGSAVPSSTR